MADFLPGDIIVVDFPYEENPSIFKSRPALVISKIDATHYLIAKITKTNLVGKIKGEWIDEKSKEYLSMRLNFPSFIRLENLISIPVSLIKKGPIGKYPDIENLLKIYDVK